ncbi:MAG: ATP-grasp domain-containing protein, partial [Pirellulales bacterium]
GKADDEEEFDAPETIAALADALAGLGHQVELLGDGEPMLRKLLGGPRPDLVLNIAEGQGCSRSREARVPGVLEMLGIPYTGSDPLALAVTLDKDCAKRLVREAGVATPDWVLVEEGDLDAVRGALARFNWPLIVKPAYEGSSKGIRSASLVHDQRALEQAVASLADAYRQPILVEEFIDGDELTVGVVGNRPARVLGVMRIVPTRPGPFIYGLEVKRDWRRLVRYECPARLSAADTAAVERAALAAWRALGCRDVARIDFRLKQGTAYFLEANPLPGLSPESGDLVLMAGQLGMTHRELISKILEAAMERQAVEGGCRL